MPRQQHVEYDLLEIGEGRGAAFQVLNHRDYPGPVKRAKTVWSTRSTSFHTLINASAEKFGRAKRCSFCRKSLSHVQEDQIRNDRGQSAHLKWCENCRFWLCRTFEITDRKSWHDTISVSKARSFDEVLPRGCSSEAAQFIRRRPSYFHSVDPRSLETFVADVFRANHRDAEVMHVGSPGDWGIDIIYVESSGKEWLIQVKRRENPAFVEGFSTVQALAGTLTIQGRLNGIIVTTADHFSVQARAAVAKLRGLKYCVELHDRGVLNRMLDPLLPDSPWVSMIHDYSNTNQYSIERQVSELRTQTRFPKR